MNFKSWYISVVLLITHISFSQEGIAVYSDYLTDNYYLIHPSMAGAANCAKIRLTARQQWSGQDDAPKLQTLSFNTALGDHSGVGIILFNDKNGYHSQKGAKLTYAHHLNFSNYGDELNRISFGMNAGLIQSQLDETSFGPDYDPIITGGIEKYSYFNIDIGASYQYMDFYTHLTVKNIIVNKREIYSDYESDNLRKFLFSTGYIFGRNSDVQWEPSVLFQLVQETKERNFDVNLKVYKNMDFGKIWGGLSYRRSFDKTKSYQDRDLEDVKLEHITPIIGVNYKDFMFAYTYTYLTGDVKFDNKGFHQITVGLNLFCKREKYSCNCPAVN